MWRWRSDGELAHNKSRQTRRNKSPSLTSLMAGQVIILSPVRLLVLLCTTLGGLWEVFSQSAAKLSAYTKDAPCQQQEEGRSEFRL